MPSRSKRTKPSSPKKSRARTATKKDPAPQLASFAIVVSDRRRAVRWYTETFGLQHVTDMDHWQTVGKKGQPTVVHLCQVTEYDDQGKLEPGNQGVAFHIAGDFVASCQSLADRGIEFTVPATHAEWGWWAMVKDPDGNELILLPAA